MEGLFAHTRSVLDEYEAIQNKIRTSPYETGDDEDKFLEEFEVELADALLLDADGELWKHRLLRLADRIYASYLDI